MLFSEFSKNLSFKPISHLNIFKAASVGFDDKAFHDFLKDPKSDNLRKLEQLPHDDALKPFHMWANKSDKTQY